MAHRQRRAQAIHLGILPFELRPSRAERKRRILGEGLAKSQTWERGETRRAASPLSSIHTQQGYEQDRVIVLLRTMSKNTQCHEQIGRTVSATSSCRARPPTPGTAATHPGGGRRTSGR